MAAIPQLGLVGVVALGGYLALHDRITVGTFLAFAAYVATMTAATRTLSQVVIMAQLSRAAVERVYEVIDTEPEVSDPRTRSTFRTARSASGSVTSVSASTPTGPSCPAST